MDNTATDIIQIDKLAEALAKAQSEFPVIPKDSEVVVHRKDMPRIPQNELYRYKYADLTTIISCTRPALSKNGLSFTQGMVQGGLATLIMHSSGQKLSTGFVPCEMPKTQDYKAVAGAVTYIKRISLTAALGISADEDVDAAAQEAAEGNSTAKSTGNQKKTDTKSVEPPAKPPAQQFKGPTQAMLKRLYAIGASMKWPSESVRVYCLAKVKKTPGKLSKAQYDQLCTLLEGLPYDDAQEEEIRLMYEKFTEDELALFKGEE